MTTQTTKSNNESTLTAYRWRQLTKQTGLSKGKLIATLDRCNNGNDILTALDTLF